MAKAKADTTFVGSLFQARLFKPSQGRVVRQVTGLAVAAVFVLMASRVYSTFLQDIGSTVFLGIPGTSVGVAAPGAPVRYGIPALIAGVGIWLAYRLVNWPSFANFLISVEAEMDKVSWASMDYLKRATAVVLVVMLVLGGYLFLWDILWQQFFVLIGFLEIPSGQ